MRPSNIALLVAGGALIGYLLARQYAPETVKGLEESVKTSITDFLARLEGFRSEPYPDEAGLWTIGFGHLIVPGDGFWSPSNPNGIKSITRDEAVQLKLSDMGTAQAAVNRLVRVPLTENQNVALVSLVFNIGEGNFASSTLLKKLNLGDFDGASLEFARWNKVRDPQTRELVVSNGLTKRRAEETELFLA